MILRCHGSRGRGEPRPGQPIQGGLFEGLRQNEAHAPSLLFCEASPSGLSSLDLVCYRNLERHVNGTIKYHIS